jgi:chemotaxis protein methyltransferase CheR
MSLLESASNILFTVKHHEFSFTGDDFKRISSLIYQRAGICLPPGKAEMVYNRLSRRLRALGLTSFSSYLTLLTGNGSTEWDHFIGALTTHLTAFFREEHHFPILAAHAARKAGSGRVRLWSCAASTGEEPYSMAISMADQFGTLYPPVEIMATDVDSGVLETARRGVYPIESLKTVSSRILKRYFLRGDGNNKGFVKVRPEVQQMITFGPLNLLAPIWPLSTRYDAIFCRNVLIYFDKPTQKRVLHHCQRYLAPDGLFFAGHSENLAHVADLLDPCGKTVYRPRQSQSEYTPEAPFGDECYA